MELTKNKSIVVFEVNDNNRGTHEYGRHAGRDYFYRLH